MPYRPYQRPLLNFLTLLLLVDVTMTDHRCKETASRCFASRVATQRKAESLHMTYEAGFPCLELQSRCRQAIWKTKVKTAASVHSGGEKKGKNVANCDRSVRTRYLANGIH